MFSLQQRVVPLVLSRNSHPIQCNSCSAPVPTRQFKSKTTAFLPRPHFASRLRPRPQPRPASSVALKCLTEDVCPAILGRRQRFGAGPSSSAEWIEAKQTTSRLWYTPAATASVNPINQQVTHRPCLPLPLIAAGAEVATANAPPREFRTILLTAARRRVRRKGGTRLRARCEASRGAAPPTNLTKLVES